MRHEWSPEDAERVARDATLAALDDRHWKVIAAVREDAARRRRAPCLRRVAKLTGLEAAELHRLFPGDSESLIARIAGLAPPSCGAVASELVEE